MTRSSLRDRDLAEELRSALRREPDTLTDRLRDTVDRASETAADTRARAEELSDAARHRTEAARERAAEVSETVRERAEAAREAAEDARERLDDFVEEARPLVERILATLAAFLSDLAERGRSAASKVPPPASERRRQRLRTAGWFAGGFTAGLAVGWLAHARFEAKSHGAEEPFYEEQLGFDRPSGSPYGTEAEAIDVRRP